jgi:hypothetical protein
MKKEDRGQRRNTHGKGNKERRKKKTKRRRKEKSQRENTTGLGQKKKKERKQEAAPRVKRKKKNRIGLGSSPIDQPNSIGLFKMLAQDLLGPISGTPKAQAQSILGPRRIQSPTEMGTRHIQRRLRLRSTVTSYYS